MTKLQRVKLLVCQVCNFERSTNPIDYNNPVDKATMLTCYCGTGMSLIERTIENRIIAQKANINL